MTFEKEKNSFLKKIDKSIIGKIDPNITGLVKKINQKENYYTTSSCAGRCVLLHKKAERKKDTKWLFVTHDNLKYNELKDITIPIDGQVWFLVEPIILHICCKEIIDANKMLITLRNVFKRSAIISINKKIIIEVIGTDKIDTIIAEKGQLVVTEDYLKILAKEANKKINRNIKKIKKLISFF